MAKEFVLKINGEPAAKTIQGIQDQIAALDEQIKTSDINDPDFSRLIEESNKAKQSLGVLQKEGLDGLKPKGAIDGLKSIGSSLSSIPGPIGGAISGFQGLSKAAMGFVMNPIGAVVAALGAIFITLQKALKSTDAGMDAMNKVTAAFAGIIRPIVKIVEDLAVVLAEGLASALEFVGSLFGSTTSEMVKYTDQLDKIGETEEQLAVDRAKQNKELAAAKELLTDTNATIEARRAALDKVKASEIALAEKEQANAKAKVDAYKALNKLESDSEENRKRLRDAEIALLQAETETAAKRRQFNKEEKKLNAEEEAQKKEAAAAAKAAADKAKAYADERLAAQDKIRAAEQKNLLASIKDQEERDRKAAEIDLQNSKREIDRGKYTAQEKKRLKEEADKSYAIALEKINKDSADKQKAIEKELADALVNTDAEKFAQQQQQTTDNYNKLIEKAKGNADMITKLEAQKQELLAEQLKQFNESQEAKRKAEAEKIKAEEDKAYKDKIEAITKTYDKEGALLIQKGLSERELTKQQDQLELEELQKKLEATELSNEEYYKLELELYNKKKEIRDKDREETIANLNAGYDVAASLAQGLMDLDQARTDAKLANENLSEAEREKIAKESFEKQKKLQYALAVIDAAKGVTSIIAQYPKFDGGIAMAAALITTGIATAVNIAKISSTQYQSKSGGGSGGAKKSSGSTYAMGGILQGPSHDLGGIKTSLGELEGGEFVVNRRATMDFMPLLNQINTVGQTPGPEMSQSSQQPPIIKTYVVASEMTSQQEADAKLQSLAKL
jgi:hypothetical protein